MIKVDGGIHAAHKHHNMDPGGVQQSSVLGMGFLIGSGMYGAADALIRLYVKEYGYDQLPDHIKEIIPE